MIRISKTITLLAALGLSACTPSVASDTSDTAEPNIPPAAEAVIPDQEVGDFEALLNEYLALNQRLENISYKVLSANADSCPETRRDIGLKIHTIHNYPDELQAYARAFFTLDNHPVVRIIAKESPAARAGLESGDRVLKLGEYGLVSGREAGAFFEALSTREFRYPSSTIDILRGDERRVINLTPETQCGYPAQLFYSEIVNAHTDGEEIWVTSELLRQVDSDTSLALIIAHELAHATQGHIYQTPTKALELEADRLSLIYLTKAGFDPAEALRLWQENPRHHRDSESRSHPAMAERLAVLNQTLDELKTLPQ